MKILKGELESIIVLDSLFFNITEQKYKVSEFDSYKRVDISNGLLFFDIKNNTTLTIKNLDRMVIIAITKDGELTIHDKLKEQKLIQNIAKSSIYCSSKQDMIMEFKGSVFVLFIADFFLKRYLGLNQSEPIDFLYESIQSDISLKEVDSKPLDALSLYIMLKIINIDSKKHMKSIKCEHSVIELIIHRLNLFDMIDNSLDKDELNIALKAKKYLLKNFVTPPTIETLAHQCATNETKLKQVFKKVYKMTLHNYIQKLRLEKANLLLKERLLNIGEISKKVGYKHQGHFSKLFFKSYGVYPKDLLTKN